MTLHVRTGVDLVPVARFERAWRSGGVAFERRTFHPTELVDRRCETLAGLFAVKEAVAKALDLPAGAWLEMEVTHGASGKPGVRLAPAVASGIASCDVSLSHAEGLVVATCVVLREEDGGM